MKISMRSKILAILFFLGSGTTSGATALAQDQGSEAWKFNKEASGDIGRTMSDDQSTGRIQDSSSRRIPRIEAFGSFGRGTLWGGSISDGSGLEFQGGVRYQPYADGRRRRLEVGVRLARLEHDRQYSSQFWAHSVSGSVVTAFSEVSYRFTDSRLQPFVSGGVGVVWANHVHNDTYLSDSTHWSYRIKGADLGFSFGAGLRVGVTKRWSIFPEYRFLTTGVHYNWQSSEVSLGFAYRW